MIITLAIKVDEFKLAQTLQRFSEQYKASYNMTRQNDGFLLHLKTDNFGELVRRLNHIKGCEFRIEELREGRLTDIINVDLTRTNIDALIGRSTVAQSDINPVNGGLIKLVGELWFCRPKQGKVIKENARVRVVGVEGVSLIVEEVKE